MAEIVLQGVRRVHPDGTAALDGVDLTVGDGELVGVIGPSGSGKSTLLRVMAGLDSPAAGRVLIAGRDVTGAPVRERNVAFVAQSRTLYTFMTVAEQLAFPLELRRLGGEEVGRRTAAERRALGLGRIWHRKPPQLSAGEAQRTALARAMVRIPDAMLLDEPLQLLDAGDQARMRGELRRFHEGTAMTTVFATNDHHQVLGIADRVVVLRAGRIVQCASPQTLLRRPCDRWVAGFVGEPPMTAVPAVVGAQGGLGWLQVGDQRLRFPGGLPGPLRERVGGTVLLSGRPDVIRAPREEDSVDVRLRGAVVRVQRLGAQDLVDVAVPTGEWVAAFPARSGLGRGDAVEVAVDVRALSVFDAQDGTAVWHGG